MESLPCALHWGLRHFVVGWSFGENILCVSFTFWLFSFSQIPKTASKITPRVLLSHFRHDMPSVDLSRRRWISQAMPHLPNPFSMGFDLLLPARHVDTRFFPSNAFLGSCGRARAPSPRERSGGTHLD